MLAARSEQPPEKVTADTKTNYGRIAKVYELGAYLGSNGQIQISKKHHLTLLNKPSRILYPGAGIGIEVAEAAKAGHDVTIVELNPGMLEAAKAYFREQGVEDKVNCVLGSILDHHGEYDVVVANYFLCVFDQKMMRTMFKHLTTLVKSDGLLCLSGYGPMHGSPVHKAIQWANHEYANIFCVLVMNNAKHPIYDYEPLFDEMGVKKDYIHDFKHFGTFGPRFHRMWAVRKK
jgi:ubiquinone/menaquinone biosynthesis C-methylase UbiE